MRMREPMTIRRMAHHGIEEGGGGGLGVQTKSVMV